MGSTLNIIGAFILGGLIPFGAMGAVIGYYWARADVRRAMFEWFNEHWPDDYTAVYEQANERKLFRGIGVGWNRSQKEHDTDGRS